MNALKDTASHNENRLPREYDLVLGGNNPLPTDGLVLGGIAGVKRRLASKDIEVRIAALSDAIKYGDEGLEVFFQSLEDKIWRIQRQSYLYLKESNRVLAKQKLDCFHDNYFSNNFKEAYTFNSHTKKVTGLIITSDNKLLISSSEDGKINIYNLYNGRQITTFYRIKAPITAIGFNLIQEILAIANNNKIEIFSLRTGELINTLVGHSQIIVSVDFDTSGNLLVSGSLDKTAKVWNLETGTIIHTLNEYSGWVNSVAISYDSETIITGSQDRKIRFWDLNTRELKHIISAHLHLVDKIIISTDEQIIVSSSWDNTVKVWDYQTGEKLYTFSKEATGITSIDIHDNDRILVVGYINGTVDIWNLITGNLITTLPSYTYPANCVAIQQDNLITGFDDGTIKIWKIE